MTQIALTDLAASTGRHVQSQPAPNTKGRGHFAAAFHQAQSQEGARLRHDAVTRPADSQAEALAEAQPEAASAEATPAGAQAQAPADVVSTEPKAPAPEAPQAEATEAAPVAEAPVAISIAALVAEQVAEQTQASAAEAELPAPSEAEEMPTETDPQALLALMLAAGSQVSFQGTPATTDAAQATDATSASATVAAVATTTVETPAMATPIAETSAEADAAPVPTPAAPAAPVAPPTAEATKGEKSDVAAAVAKAVAEAAQAEKGVGQAVAKAAHEAQDHPAHALPSNASPVAQARLAAHQVTGAIAQAAQGLGPIKVQVARNDAPVVPSTTSVGAPTPPPTGETTNNLVLQLVADAAARAPLGPTAPVTVSDEAIDLETLSLLPAPGDDDSALPGTSDAVDPATLTPSLNGADKPSDAAKIDGPKSQAAPQPADVVPQLLRHADQLKANQQNSIKLQLYPEHLGKMEIRVVSHQGVLSAQLSADSQGVKAMLETQVASLQRSFAEMGLKVDKVEVTLSSTELGQQGSDQAGMFFDQGQGSDRQQPSGTPRGHQGQGYAQWIEEPIVEAEAYAALDTTAAVDYVA